MRNKAEREFIKKYDEQIRGIARAENVDMGVGEAMFIYEVKCEAGLIERVDTYKGIEGYDFTEAIKDFEELKNPK